MAIKQAKTDHNSCRPPSGKTYLTVGQDFFSIQEYFLSQYNASLEGGSTRPMSSFHPAATMFYTDIQELRGLAKPVDYGSGIEYAGALAESFPHSGIQIGLWLNGTKGCQDIVDGNLDIQILEMYNHLERLRTPKVFLRVGYEFDNPWFGYSSNPLLYKKAFRKLVLDCEKHLSKSGCHRVISFCWHSWAAPKIAPLETFYPGDKYVDWVGISIFQQLYPWANLDKDSNDTDHDFAGGQIRDVKEVLEFSQQHDKPVMIAESTPFGGMTFEGQPPLQIDFDWKRPDGTLIEKNIWDLWFQPTLDLIESYDIGMWSYINCDWDSQPMWKGVGFGDTRLSSAPKVMANWRTNVLGKDSRFLTELECSKGDYHTSSNMHRSHPRNPKMAATISGTKDVGLHIFDYCSFILPTIIIAGILMLVIWVIRQTCCQFAVEQVNTGEPTATTGLNESHEKLYGSASMSVKVMSQNSVSIYGAE